MTQNPKTADWIRLNKTLKLICFHFSNVHVVILIPHYMRDITIAKSLIAFYIIFPLLIHNCRATKKKKNYMLYDKQSSKKFKHFHNHNACINITVITRTVLNK